MLAPDPEVGEASVATGATKAKEDGLSRPRITCAENGPYLVEGLEDLRGAEGAIPTQAKVALCRCGGSSKKPFCDGTHKHNGFRSAKSEERVRDRRKSYAGKSLTVHDNRGICAHAAECTERLASVFRQHERPWIDPDAASPEEIAAVVRACPSGALSYSIDGVERRERDGETPRITVVPKGPYQVTGGCELLGESRGEGAAAGHYTLCRCGASRNKPFCDGAHWNTSFE